MTAPKRGVGAIGTALGLLVLTACTSLNDPSAGWDEPANYTATIAYNAYDIDAGTYRIEVVNHEVLSFTRVDHRGVILAQAGGPDPVDLTLRQVVGAFQTALADPESVESITFDDNHQPEVIDIDWQPLQFTDEQTWTILRLEIDEA